MSTRLFGDLKRLLFILKLNVEMSIDKEYIDSRYI
jgi:hypothetical protein